MRRLSRVRAVSLLLGLSVARPAAVRDGTPAVGLHHLTLVPDSATFEAIASSAFLRDTFALVDRFPDVRPERVALVGRSTYVEFRRPSGTSRPWSSGVALGTDERGALRTVAKRLTSEIGPLRIDSVSRRRDSLDIPWLYELAGSASGPDSTLALRVVEYHPQFVRGWYGGTSAASKSVARRDVLALHTAHASAPRRYPFVDVVAIKVAASKDAAATLVAHCRGVGWRVQRASDGTACVGPGVRLFVVPARAHERGIVAFTMRVAPIGKSRITVRRFGSGTLRLSRSGFATWDFRQE